MKKILILIIASIFTSCNNSNQITITKLKGSPSYENSKLKIQGINFDLLKLKPTFSILKDDLRTYGRFFVKKNL